MNFIQKKQLDYSLRMIWEAPRGSRSALPTRRFRRRRAATYFTPRFRSPAAEYIHDKEERSGKPTPIVEEVERKSSG